MLDALMEAIRADLVACEVTDPAEVVEIVTGSGRKHIHRRSRSLPPDVRFTEGFRTCTFKGDHFPLTRTQARVVGVLVQAWLNGTAVMDQQAILCAADSGSDRLDHVFRAGQGKKAWGKLIVRCGKGLYRLNIQQPENNA